MDPAGLSRRGRRLEWITIGWNAIESLVTVSLGVVAGSFALVAFGLDSIVEIFASVVVIRQLKRDPTSVAGMRRAVRRIGLAFLVLGSVLVVFAVVRLIGQAHPKESPLGIAYLTLTVVVMFTLGRLKGRTGGLLGNVALRVEARVSYLDGLLGSGILLALVVNALFGWWWADPLAAAVVGVMALGEAREHLATS